jgi:hypothetical protein
MKHVREEAMSYSEELSRNLSKEKPKIEKLTGRQPAF